MSESAATEHVKGIDLVNEAMMLARRTWDAIREDAERLTVHEETTMPILSSRSAASGSAVPADSTAAQDRRRMYQALRRNGWGRWAAWREAVKYARLPRSRQVASRRRQEVRMTSAAQGHFWTRLPRDRRQACWWWLRLRFQWYYWRQARLIEPLWSWWVNRG